MIEGMDVYTYLVGLMLGFGLRAAKAKRTLAECAEPQETQEEAYARGYAQGKTDEAKAHRTGWEPAGTDPDRLEWLRFAQDLRSKATFSWCDRSDFTLGCLSKYEAFGGLSTKQWDCCVTDHRLPGWRAAQPKPASERRWNRVGAAVAHFGSGPDQDRVARAFHRERDQKLQDEFFAQLFGEEEQ